MIIYNISVGSREVTEHEERTATEFFEKKFGVKSVVTWSFKIININL